jgi:hypothetical protein
LPKRPSGSSIGEKHSWLHRCSGGRSEQAINE